MLHPDEALRLILKNTRPLGEEKVPLPAAVGRVLSRIIKASTDLPSFDSSAMDGYAVKAADLRKAGSKDPVYLKILAPIRAGSVPRQLIKNGEAAPIMTGAPIPKGADAVVMVERTKREGKTAAVFQKAEKGDHIRNKGEDVKKGKTILKKGAVLRPYDIALLAAQGVSKVPVIKKPRAAVIATGDELVDAGSALSFGKIRNSNGPAVSAALKRWGIPTDDLGIAKDDAQSLRKIFARALKKYDLLLVTGGVSVGDFDFTKKSLLTLGVRELFWKTAIKPGKPLFFAKHKKGFVFGLPGNPVSVLVCLEEFLRPALENLQGKTSSHPGYHMMGKALNHYPAPKDRRQYLFCRAESGKDGFTLKIIRPQGSAMLAMASQANALAVAELGKGRVIPGAILPFRWLK